MSPRVGLDLLTIINTAAEIANTEGVDNVTLAAIARKLNVRPPSLFNHIQGLPDLKRRLSLYGLTLLNEKLTEAAMGKMKDEALFSMAYGYLEFSRDHNGLYDLTLSAPESNDEEMQNASSKIIQLLSNILNDYQLTKEDTIHAIRALRSILHGFSSLEQKQAFKLAVEPEDSFQVLMAGFVSYLNQLAN
ncbi:TetR-like C-terminal domain-containing protein [Ureibacillus sp. NPDC094379]